MSKISSAVWTENGKPYPWRRYPAYKPSGVEWLGEVPESWNFMRFRFIFEILKGKNINVTSQFPQDGYYPCINVNYLRNCSPDTYVIQDQNSVLVNDNDILVLWDGSNSGEFLKGKFGILGSTLAKCKINNQKAKDFVFYSCKGIESILKSQTIGMGIPHVDGEILKNLPIPLPPLPEQRAIVAFLDRETARIDALIEKKEQQIELLKEKRASLISHAVTKGLDPNVKMKDSGVEGLGTVPKDWDVIPLKYGWDVIDCKHITAEYVDEGIPIVSTTEVKPGRLSLLNTRQTTESDYINSIDGRCPKRGDIIYSRNASLGSAAYVDTDEKFCMGQDVCLITSTSNDQLFLMYQLNCSVVLNQIDSQMIGSTIKRINVEQIKNLTIFYPPVKEQKKISEFLDIEIVKIDNLTEKIKSSMDRLYEYRSALISAAVTGKIDVRDEAKA